MDAINYLWGKTDRDSGKYHLLIYHLIDTGNVARCLWNFILSSSIKSQISSVLNLSLSGTENLDEALFKVSSYVNQ